MDPTTLEDFLWLMSDEATEILKQTQEAIEERINAVRIAKSLRTKTTPTRAAIVMDQAHLRIRGMRKFALAGQMFFTRRGLEQSTSQDIAAYKATRFEGIASVADLCCGIGGDLQGLVQRAGAKKTCGVDSDQLTSLFAQHNSSLAADGAGDQQIQVQCCEFSDFDFSGFDAVHCDPDRRLKERTVTGDRFSPRLQEIFPRVDSRTCLALKIAPATPAPNYLPDLVQREWIGDQRECKQQVIWQGPFTDQPGFRTATCIDSDASAHQFSVPEDEVPQSANIVGEIGKYVFEPHATVLAAKMTNAIANKFQLARFCADVDYLTGDHPLHDPLLTQFEVVQTLPVKLREVVEFMNQRRIGQLEIKKRGVEPILYDQFKRLKISGPNRATVILTRIGLKRTVIIARRRPNDFD